MRPRLLKSRNEDLTEDYNCEGIVLKSGSLWPAALLRAVHNQLIQGAFDGLMCDTRRTLWYTTEFGAALAITTALFAVYFWMSHGEVEQVAAKPARAQAAA